MLRACIGGQQGEQATFDYSQPITTEILAQRHKDPRVKVIRRQLRLGTSSIIVSFPNRRQPSKTNFPWIAL